MQILPSLCSVDFFHVFYVGPYFSMRRKSILEDALARRPKHSSLLRLLSKQGNTLLLYIYRVSRAESGESEVFFYESLFCPQEFSTKFPAENDLEAKPYPLLARCWDFLALFFSLDKSRYRMHFLVKYILILLLAI